MLLRTGLACLAAAALGSCATPRQFVYNCTPEAIGFDGRSIAPRTFESRPAAPPNAKAIHADGSLHAPVTVKSSQVDSFGLTNAWISPANVCRQFGPQVVVVDLR
jgi:hypothetical protein